MKFKTIFLLAAAFLTNSGVAFSQSAHYPAGVEGIKGGTLPPPGLYLRNYTFFYTSDKFANGPADFDLFAFVPAPRVVWITETKILGGFYGMDALFTFPYQDVSVGPFGDSKFGVGDIFFEPITLSWHPDRFDAGIGYGFWTPNGSFDAANPASPGKGFWGHMFTAGGTYYLDADKTWALSALNRYEFNQEIDGTDIQPGQVWTVEFALSKTIDKTIDLGLSGYYVLQTTEDSGRGSTSAKDRVFGLGPEISVFWPKAGLFTSARWIIETAAQNRPEGHTINLTVTKPF